MTGILDNSAYESAGGQINDVVTSIGGEPVTTLDQMLTKIRLLRADDSVTITVLRGDTETQLSATMGLLEP